MIEVVGFAFIVSVAFVLIGKTVPHHYPGRGNTSTNIAASTTCGGANSDEPFERVLVVLLVVFLDQSLLSSTGK